MSWTQWWENLSLAERVPAKVSRDFIPTHSQQLANDICLEPYSSTNHILSILEGMWSVVGRKSGGLAVAQHILSELEEREENTADVPAPADIPAPAPTLETVEEQPYTPGSRKSMRKNLGRPASTFSDFYM